MSEPAIAVSQEGLGRRREEIEKVPDEVGRNAGTCRLTQHSQAGPVLGNTRAASTSCAWLPLAELGSRLSTA